MSVYIDDNKVECCVCDRVCFDRWIFQKYFVFYQIFYCFKCEQYFINSRELQEYRKFYKEIENFVFEVFQMYNINQVKFLDIVIVSLENVKSLDFFQKLKAKRNRRFVEIQCEICRKVFKNLGNYYRYL